jgi:large subunit ribosomal protein L20
MTVARRPLGGGLSDLTSSLAALGLHGHVSAAPATASATTPTTPTQTTTPAAHVATAQRRTFATKRFHHKKIIKAAKGYRGQANRNFRAAIKRVERARQNAYRDRRLRRREFRKLWIQRLNAGVRQHGVRYSRFINMLNKSEVQLDRKILSELAMHEPFSFKAVVDVVKSRDG